MKPAANIMRNFYREFTKDLERRLSSRAYDISPQTVLNNEVQMTVDIEREYYRDVTWAWRQLSISQNPLTSGPQGNLYGQTPVVFTGAVVTPLTNGATAEAATLNRPTYFANRDSVERLEILDLKFLFQLRNNGANPTSTSHRLKFAIQKFGTGFDSFDRDFGLDTTAAIVPAGSAQIVSNLTTPNQTIVRLPNIWTNSRVSTVVSPGTPFASGVDNQVTWLIQHEFDPSLETEVTLLDINFSMKCRVYFETPYNVQTRTPLASQIPP